MITELILSGLEKGVKLGVRACQVVFDGKKVGVSTAVRASKAGRKEMIVVRLEDLAESLWLRYNEEFKPQSVEPDSAEKQTPAEVKEKEEKCETEKEEKGKKSIPTEKTASTQTGPDEKPSEPVVSAKTATQPKKPDFISESAYRDLVEPYVEIFESQGVLRLVQELFSILDRFGGCPSVVQKKPETDPETEEIKEIRNGLEKIELKDHSFRVAKLMVKYTMETYRDYELHIPKVVVTALAHDIGKIPEFREKGLYTTYEHAKISANKLEELFKRLAPEVQWKNQVVEAVRCHHQVKGSSDLHHLLRFADGKARMHEVAEISELYVKEWKEWFDTKRLFEILKPRVNAIDRQRKTHAFTLGGIVYVLPHALFQAAKEMAREKKVIEMKFIRESDRTQALLEIVKSLEEAGVLFYEIPEGRYCRHFKLEYTPGFRSSDKEKELCLVAVRPEAFGDPNSLPKLTAGPFVAVRRVIPK